jgi:hypothetical protein
VCSDIGVEVLKKGGNAVDAGAHLNFQYIPQLYSHLVTHIAVYSYCYDDLPWSEKFGSKRNRRRSYFYVRTTASLASRVYLVRVNLTLFI